MAQYTFDTLLDFDIANTVLPSGYTKLNYIENQGNASTYIDTGYIPNANTELRIVQSINADSMSSNGYIGTYRYGFGLKRNKLYLYVNTTYYETNINLALNTPTLFKIINHTGQVYVNDTIVRTQSMNFPIGGTFWIGRVNNFNEYLNGKVYYHEFLENGISIQRMIPCEDGNGNIGMYDVVADTFFANQGTNPFISGGVAPIYSFQNGDEIIISSTKNHYQYQDGDLVFWYQEIPPLVFKGITFEMVNTYKVPDLVFRGFSFEELFVKKSNISLFHGMS